MCKMKRPKHTTNTEDSETPNTGLQIISSNRLNINNQLNNSNNNQADQLIYTSSFIDSNKTKLQDGLPSYEDAIKVTKNNNNSK